MVHPPVSVMSNLEQSNMKIKTLNGWKEYNGMWLLKYFDNKYRCQNPRVDVTKQIQKWLRMIPQKILQL